MTTVTSLPGIWTGTIFADKQVNKVYRAKKCNPKNIRSVGMDGKTWNIPWELAREATPEEKARYEAWEESQKDPDENPLDSIHRIGQVVRFKDPTKKEMEGLFVVTRSKADGYSLAWLGGNVQNRYWPTVAGNRIVNVDGMVEVTNR
jgi:hypothetical protein